MMMLLLLFRCDTLLTSTTDRLSVREFIFNFIYFCSLQQGYFRTSKGSFFIEPIEEYVDENRNILHLLYKHPPIDGDSEKYDDVAHSHGEFLNIYI
jgi:hypothetical protein